MVSDDMARSSGASGIAWDADIAIRLRPMAKPKAVSIFMDFSFPLVVRRQAADLNSQTIQRPGNAGPPHQQCPTPIPAAMQIQ
jgi:hypothetical protein